ncbi:MAG: tetraacyldisaccharide 4'-kinase [Smithellaceae bacterium]
MINWQRIWNDDDEIRRFSPTRAILYTCSLLYRLIVDLRNQLYDRQILKSVKLPCPVISVGNITVGGTGKTPCVIGLAQMLQKRGFKSAVISRGYGGKSPKTVNIVSDGKSILLGVEDAGDEPLLIARSLPGVPVITGAKRKITGQAAIDRFGCDVLICDDAFQHRQIVRDIDIVLLDADKPLGNGHLLPRGRLREPVTSIHRASCLIITRSDDTGTLQPDIARIAETSAIPIFRATHIFTEMVGPDEMRLPPEEMRGKKVCAFCGIAKPASFKKLLLEAETDILSFIEFSDHYAYDHYDLEKLKKHFMTLGADYWITTEKDAMRLAAYPDFLKTLCVLRMEMRIKPSEPSFEHFITERLNAVVKSRR